MAIDNVQDLLGEKGDPCLWRIETGKVREFAKALDFADPLCFDQDAATGAGYAGVVAPPTFPVSSTLWMSGPPPLRKAKFDRRRVLQGEQEFEYHRPIQAGMELEGTPEIVDVTQKEGKRGGMMTLLTTEIVWREAGSDDPVVTTRSVILETAPKN